MISFAKINRFSGVIEQVLSSGGNFIFFLWSARIFDVNQFSEFAVIFTAVQMIHGIALQWCFLPIVSYPKNVGNSVVFKITVKKLIILFSLSPPFLFCYFEFINPDIIADLSIFKLCIFTASFIIYDFFKFYLIRISAVILIIFMHFIKWGSVMYLLLFYSDTTEIYNVFFVPIVFIVMTVSPYLAYKNSAENKVDNKIIPLLETKPLLIQAVANNVQTFFITASFLSLNIGLFGAYIAFRSLTNVLPMLMQYFESHISISAVNKGEVSILNNKMYLWIISLSVVLIVFSFIFRDSIISIIYGENYLVYSYILPITLTIVVIQSITRLLNVELRLQSKVKILYLTSLISIVSGVGAYSLSLLFDDVFFLLLILILAPVMQLFVVFVANHVSAYFNDKIRILKVISTEILRRLKL
tara:strand:- start:1284 stop:2525 length:1242 start_codon:yes stop_codon:yes gene_type:complete